MEVLAVHYSVLAVPAFEGGKENLLGSVWQEGRVLALREGQGLEFWLASDDDVTEEIVAASLPPRTLDDPVSIAGQVV